MDSAAPELQIIEEWAVDPVPGATAAAIDPTQRVMAVGYTTGTVRLFVAGRPAGTGVSTGGACPVQHLAFVPGEPALAAIDKRGVLRVLDTDTLNVCFEYTVPVPPTCAGLIPGTSWLMVGTESGRVYFVDVVAGRKADFSVGCLSKPLSAVVAVEAHPVEAEKFLVAYASGECVVGDLGRAAGTEKAMVLSRHRLENPPDVGMAVVQLRAACWSPTGDRIAAAYSNGVVCVFGTGAGAGPVAAWAIPCPDARAADEAQLVPTGLRWCTHAQLDCSFLVATSQTAAGTESYVHTFGTKDRDAGVKSNRDVTDGGTATLDSPLLAINAIPHASPWRGGNDGVRRLAALVGRPARVQLLEVLPTMGLRPSNELPDELEWCRVAPRIVHRAAGELNPGLGRFLAGTLRRGQLMAAGSPDVASQDAAAEPQAIARLYCCVDDSDVLSFWCAASQRLQRCHGLGLDLRQLARLAGVESSVSSVSLCAKSGLLAVGMPGGEVLLALLTSDPWASLAQRYTPLDELREQAAAYYSTAAATGSRAPADDRAAHHATPQDPQTIPDAVAEAAEPTDVRASNPTTPHEARLLRRSSKRISASVGMLLRRASLIGDSDKGSRERRRTVAAGNDSRRHRMSLPVHRTRASAGADLGADLARPAVVASSDWSEQLDRLGAELSQMLCGMHFNRDEQQRIFGNVQADEASRPKPGAGAAPRIESTPRPYALPFMLARFVGRPITSLAASGDGLVAIAYACGALVVIDSGHQRVLLADNINMAPAADSSAASLFGGGHAQPASSVVAVAFSLPLDHGQLDATAGRSALQRTLLAGTSQGHVLEYAIGDQARPPRVIARPSADPIVYVWSDDGSGSGLGEASTLTAAEGATGISRRPFLAASTSAVALYAGPGADPTAAYALPDTDAKLVAARVVSLGAGWRGVAAVDCMARAALLSLPDLRPTAWQKLPGGAATPISSAAVHIGESGDICVLGSHGRLQQARIAAGASGETSPVTGTREAARHSCFDPSLRPPARPARKGLASWLLGKATDPSRDIDQLLASHHRNLLGPGTRQPGARLRTDPAQKDAQGAAAPAGGLKRQDSMVEDVGAKLAATPLGEARELLERRGQQLDEIGEVTHHVSQQAKSFLDDMREYNAKQKRQSKRRLGLF